MLVRCPAHLAFAVPPDSANQLPDFVPDEQWRSPSFLASSDDKSEKESSLKQEIDVYDDLIPMIEEDNFEIDKKNKKHHDSSDSTSEFKAARSMFYLRLYYMLIIEGSYLYPFGPDVLSY